MPFLTAALWGAFSSLGLAAFAYLANDLTGVPDLPSGLVQHLATLLGVTRPLPLSSHMAGFAFIGAIVGLALWFAAYRLKRRNLLLGAAFGLGSLALLLLIGRILSAWDVSLGGQIFYALLFSGWGAILARLQRDHVLPTGPTASEPPTRAAHRRQFLYLTILGVLTLVLSALRIDYFR